MANSSTPSLPGVTVDEGRVSDFLEGIRGSAIKSNAKARKRAELLFAGAVIYTAYKSSKKSRRK